MTDKWYVLLSDLQDGDVEKLMESTDYDAHFMGSEICFGVGPSGRLNFYCRIHQKEGYARLTRSQALEKMGIEV